MPGHDDVNPKNSKINGSCDLKLAFRLTDCIER